MDRKLAGDLDIEISFVFCNWSNDEEDNPKRDQRSMFFDMVRSYGIPLVTLSWKEFEPELRERDEPGWRDEYGKALRASLKDYPFDLGILAGYMLWMDDATCDEYDMLNLHPALPDGPKGTWQEVIWQLISSGASRQGAMMHVCTSDWDRGAAITYCGFPIRGGDYDDLWSTVEGRAVDEIKSSEGQDNPLFKRIREDGAKRELPLITETISAFADGRIRIQGKRPVTAGGVLEGAYDLTDLVDERLGERYGRRIQSGRGLGPVP